MFRGLGLCKNMGKIAMGLAVKDGAEAIVAESLGETTFRMDRERLGLRVIRSLDYASFEFRGSRPLANVNMGNDRTAYLMGRRLSSESDCLERVVSDPSIAKLKHRL